MPVMPLMLGFFQKSGCFRMLMVKVGRWVRIFELLTVAYVGGGWMGGYGRIPCLRNMWMTLHTVYQFIYPEDSLRLLI